MRNLVLITSHFPFGSGEPFLDEEFIYLHRSFERIVIIACDTSSDLRRTLPEGTIICRYNTTTAFSGYLLLPFRIIQNLKPAISSVANEIQFRGKSGSHMNRKRIFLMIKKIIKAIELKSFIERTIRQTLPGDEPIILYSYWANSGAIALSMLGSGRYIKVARGHGSDLYEEKNLSQYLPFQKLMAERLDAFFFISENGKRYISEKTNIVSRCQIVSRLGVRFREYSKTEKTDSGPFIIVSCSSLIPLKRVHIIVVALSLVNSERKIHWTHFGDGPLRNDIESTALNMREKNENISTWFPGQVTNDFILDYYRNNYVSLFINVSETEGIPVSIMEAQSSGIPVTAPRVGGISEIINSRNGFLLEPDFTPQDLAGVIKTMMDIDPSEEDQMRTASHNDCFTNFISDNNYTAFIKHLNSIFEEKTGPKSHTNEN